MASPKPVSELQDEMASRKKQAEEAFRKNHEALAEHRRQQREAAAQAELTEADMAARAMHLRRQREKIVAKKKADREAAVQASRKEEQVKAEEFRRKIEKFSDGGGDTDQVEPDPEAKSGGTDEAAEERRASMRIALAARMKRDMLLAEEERLSKLQSDQFAELDSKLRRVESLREENRKKEDELKRAIRDNQNLRAMSIQRSGIN